MISCVFAVPDCIRAAPLKTTTTPLMTLEYFSASHTMDAEVCNDANIRSLPNTQCVFQCVSICTFASAPRICVCIRPYPFTIYFYDHSTFCKTSVITIIASSLIYSSATAKRSLMAADQQISVYHKVSNMTSFVRNDTKLRYPTVFNQRQLPPLAQNHSIAICIIVVQAMTISRPHWTITGTCRTSERAYYSIVTVLLYELSSSTKFKQFILHCRPQVQRRHAQRLWTVVLDNQLHLKINTTVVLWSRRCIRMDFTV